MRIFAVCLANSMQLVSFRSAATIKYSQTINLSPPLSLASFSNELSASSRACARERERERGNPRNFSHVSDNSKASFVIRTKVPRTSPRNRGNVTSADVIERIDVFRRAQPRAITKTWSRPRQTIFDSRLVRNHERSTGTRTGAGEAGERREREREDKRGGRFN